MANPPREVLNPFFFDDIVPGSPSAVTSDSYPGKVMVKAEVRIPGATNPRTLLVLLDQDDARKLHEGLSKWMKGTSN
jgi:hypothetical protein